MVSMIAGGSLRSDQIPALFTGKAVVAEVVAIVTICIFLAFILSVQFFYPPKLLFSTLWEVMLLV